jgi:hypothetical protein
MAIDTEGKRRQALYVFPSPNSSVDNDDRTILMAFFRIGVIAAGATGIALLIDVRDKEDLMIDINAEEDLQINIFNREDLMIDIRTY